MKKSILLHTKIASWVRWKIQGFKFLFRKFVRVLLSLLVGSLQWQFRRVFWFPSLLIFVPRPSYLILLCLNDKLFRLRNHRPERWLKFWFDHLKRRACFNLQKNEKNVRVTYSIQSIANNRETSFVGRPKAVNTNSMVTNAALGMLAAPTLAKVAVRL